jgi:hypothetical protein
MLALATKMLEVLKRSLWTCFTSITLFLISQRTACAFDGHTTRLPSPLARNDITLVGSNRSYLPSPEFSIEQSDGVTAISKYLLDQTLKEFDIKRPIEVIPNFVNCDFMSAGRSRQRAKWAPGGEPILMHLSNFRP